MYFTPASGTGLYYARAAKIIRLHRKGCTNRPFFHLVVTQRCRSTREQVIEQLGTYDQLTNQYGEQMVGVNVERINHWIGRGAHISIPAAKLLGLTGLLPIHPRTMLETKQRLVNQSEAASTE